VERLVRFLFLIGLGVVRIGFATDAPLRPNIIFILGDDVGLGKVREEMKGQSSMRKTISASTASAPAAARSGAWRSATPHHFQSLRSSTQLVAHD
jgi:hypothetical protein